MRKRKCRLSIGPRDYQRDGRPHLHIGLHNGERLIDIGKDVVRVLDADRQSDVSLSDAGLKLLSGDNCEAVVVAG